MRCQKRGVACSSDSLEQVTFSVERIEDGNSVSSQSIQLVPGNTNTDRTNDACSVEEIMPSFEGNGPDFQLAQSIAPLTGTVDAWPQMDFDLSFPSFFESIMVPESSWVGTGEVQMPPDLALPDYEEWPGAGDIFGFDFSTAFEQVMDANNNIEDTAASANAANPSGATVTDPSANSARQRHHIFQKSPW